MKIVCISDTHLRAVEVPDGDVLVHAGDFTMGGTLPEVHSFCKWLGQLPHPHKVVIAGNHDWLFQRRPDLARPLLSNVIYLEDALAEVAGLRIWGSPWQPRFGDWAFNLDRGPALRAKWDLVPDGIDILVTHGPPALMCDLTAGRVHVGCEDLRIAVEERKPRLHVFGHIHEGYGVVETPDTVFVNASICDKNYFPTNMPVVVEL